MGTVILSHYEYRVHFKCHRETLIKSFDEVALRNNF